MLAPGQSVTFSINDVSLTLDDGTPGSDPFVNTVTVNATDDEGTAATDTDTATISVNAVAPAITVVKTADPTTVNEGGQSVTYTYEVTNTSASSTDPLTLTALVDDRGTAATGDDVDLLTAGTFVGGDTNGNTLIDAGETWTYTYTTGVTLNADASLTNVVTATGVDDEGTSDSDTDDATVTGLDVAPAITVVKTADPTTVNEGGQSVTYTYEVTNTSASSTDPLTLTALVDDRGTAATGDDVDLLTAGTFVGGDTNGNTLIDAGETWTYTYTTGVTLNADASLTNVVTATGVDDEGTSDSDTDDATVTGLDVAPAITVVKTADPTTVNEGGQSVTYTYEVTNTSASSTDPLTLTALVDDRGTAATGDDVDLLTAGTFVGGDTNGNTLIDAGETWTYTYTTGVTLNADASLTNVVTATGVDDEGTSDSDTDDATVTGLDVAPAITVVKTADPTTVNEGGQSVTYTYEVTNTSASSTDPLTLTALVDDRGTAATGDDVDLLTAGTFVGGDTNGNTLIDAGETWTYTYTTGVTLNADASLTNVVTATGVDDEGTSDSDTDDATVTGLDVAPAITVVKTADPTTVNEGGQSVTYTYEVTNTSASSTDPLTLTALVDDRGTAATGDDVDLLTAGTFVGGDTNGNTLIDAGETWTYTYTTGVTLNADASLTNVVTATGVDDEGTSDSDTDDATVTGLDVAPAITVVKTADPTTINEGGADVSFHFVITAAATNASTDPVTVTALTDDVYGDLLAAAIAANGGNPIVLNPGASFAFDYNPPGDLVLDAGESETNTVTVNATDDEGTAATDTDTATISVNAVAPAITVVKTADPTTVNEGGQSVTYTYEVTNTSASSTDPLTLTALVDDRGTAATGDDVDLLTAGTFVGGDTNGNTLIDAGETWTYTYTTGVTLNADASLTNVVTATGVDDEGTSGSDTDDATVTGLDVAPAITVVKTADPTTVNEGGQSVTYTYEVTNTSASSTDPLTLTALVDDRGTAATGDDVDLLTAGTFVGGDTNGNTLIDAGETWTYTYTTGVTLNADASLTNVVTATGVDDEGTSGSDTDDATVTGLDVAPAITVVKTADPTTVNEGGQSVTYTYEVTNTSASSTDPLTLTALVDDRGTAATGDDVDLLTAGTFVGGDTNGNTLIDAGETWTYTYTTGVTLNADASLTNVVTATGVDDEGTSGSDTDDATVTGLDVAPAITVVKTADPTTVNEGGQSVTYTYEVTNTSASSTDPLTLTALVDDRGTAATGDDVDLLTAGTFVGGDTNGNTLIDAGETWTYTYTTGVTLNADASLTNVVTATGVDDEGTSDSDTDDATVTGLDVAPAITVVKTADPTTVNEGGQSVTYTYEVTNTSASSTDPLTLTALVDDRGTAATGDDVDLLTAGTFVGGDTNGNTLIDAGETWTYTYTTGVTLNADASLTNVVTATGVDDEGTSDSDTDDATVTGLDVAPAITVVKTADPTTINEGGADVSFHFVITAAATNASTDPVTVTALTDDVYGDLLAAAIAANGGNPIVLNPGASFAFDYNPPGDLVLDAGESETNTVTVNATDDEGTAATDSDDATVVADDIPHPVLEQVFVDEDFLPAGHQDLPVSPGDGPGGTSQTDTITLDFGADAAGATISFAALNGQQVFDTSPAAVQTSATNSNLFYLWDDASDTLYASTDITDLNTAIATAAFKLQITDAPTGAYTFTLLQALEHAPGSGATDNTEDPNIVLSLAYTATDGDDDSASGTISVTIDDDMPLPITPGPLVGSNVAGTSATAFLDSDDNIDDNVGADQTGTVRFPTSLNGPLRTDFRRRTDHLYGLSTAAFY